MKFKVRTSGIILLILSIISFFSLIFMLYQINTDLVEALNIYKSEFDISDIIFAVGYLFVLIFHIYAIIYTYSHFHQFKQFKPLTMMTLIIGIISLFAMAGEKVMFDEIAREYRFGMGIQGEFLMLNIAFFINLTFTILFFFLLINIYRLSYTKDSEDKLVDEKIFTIAQIMGIVSSILGIYFTFFLMKRQVLADRIWIYIPFLLLFLVPYIIAVGYWLALKLKLKITDWYDEKQFQDILKSSLTTLLLSIPGLMLFLLATIPAPFYWFLYYLFLILLIFSSSTLFFFKLKDID